MYLTLYCYLSPSRGRAPVPFQPNSWETYLGGRGQKSTHSSLSLPEIVQVGVILDFHVKESSIFIPEAILHTIGPFIKLFLSPVGLGEGWGFQFPKLTLLPRQLGIRIPEAPLPVPSSFCLILFPLAKTSFPPHCTTLESFFFFLPIFYPFFYPSLFSNKFTLVKMPFSYKYCIVRNNILLYHELIIITTIGRTTGILSSIQGISQVIEQTDGWTPGPQTNLRSFQGLTIPEKSSYCARTHTPIAAPGPPYTHSTGSSSVGCNYVK